jgi:MerR family transcriptional regulator, light-induced transcriptional regulator
MKLNRLTTLLSTSQVAAGLGVGVSTVKRWVEEGILPATKTAGGHRKLLLADVLEAARRNNLPVRDLAGLAGTVRGAGGRRFAGLATELYRSLLAGDSKAAHVLVEGAYRSGMSVDALADEGVGPAMQRIGRDWETGAIDVMHEHRASQLCFSALTALKHVLEASARPRRPVAVGASPEGDLSVLGGLLVELTLLEAGWNAVNLGPNTPLRSLCVAIDELHPKLVWLSISHGAIDDEFRGEYLKLYDRAQAADAALVLGGRSLGESERRLLPYTSYGDGLKHLAAFARTLHPSVRRPRRGRPPHGAAPET